jgi:prolyl-tRNA synthetase
LDKKTVIVKEKAKNVQTQHGSELLGITFKKYENFSEWYTQLIVRAELVEYYDISGCYILR